MAEQLDLAIVLKAVLDAKGFEEAQKSIKALAGKANEASAPLNKTADAGKRMGQELGGTRGPVADLTRLLLQNVGATEQAGEAAKFLGEATTATGGGVSALALGAGALVVVASFVVPKLLEWARGTKDAGQAQKDFSAALGISLEQLQEVVEKAPAATKELQALLGTMRSERAKSQTDALKEMAGRMREIEKEAAPLERTLARYNATQLQGDNLRFYPEAARAQERLAALRKEQENLKITARALEQAMLDGASVGEQAERVTRALETADRDAAKAADARKKAQEGLNAALEEGRIGQHEVAAKERQRVLDKDSKALAEQEKRRGKGKLTPEQEELLVTGDIEKQQAAARKRLADQEKGEDKQLLQDKRANNAALVSEGAASLTQFFGNNRSARIAQAIVDTYAAATRALAELGPIAGPVMAGVMIASGFKNIANMRKAEAGFDDPANDNVMRRFGMKWANDMASLLNQGFYSQVGALAGGGAGGGTTVYDQRTIHQGGTTHNYGGINGLMASSPTQFRRGLDRAMVKAVRFRGRTTMGRTGQ